MGFTKGWLLNGDMEAGKTLWIATSWLSQVSTSSPMWSNSISSPAFNPIMAASCAGTAIVKLFPTLRSFRLAPCVSLTVHGKLAFSPSYVG